MVPVFVLVTVLALLLAARPGPLDVSRVERALAARWSPALAGLVSALCVLTVWGSADAVPLYHDEGAYLLQAEIFAAGRWAMPAPPLPEFFEQMYVLVTPVLAAKYPPGHALLMTPGTLVGLPGLVPLLLTAVAGALLFALARHVANAWVALLALVVWLAMPANLHFRASYLSETTTSACWLGAWWMLLRWRDTGRRAWLVAVAAVVGWGAITRPLTMLVYAIPLGVAVLTIVARQRRWLDFGAAVATGLLVLAVLPLWSWRTLGAADRTPLAAYQAQYIPFDYPGWTEPDAVGTRALPGDLAREAEFLRDIKRAQVNAPVTELLGARLAFFRRAFFGDWRVVLLPAFAIGLLALGVGGTIAIASSALLVLAYLGQAHTPDWISYYVELFPVIAFVSTLGFHRFAQWIAARAEGAAGKGMVAADPAAGSSVVVGGGPPMVGAAANVIASGLARVAFLLPVPLAPSFLPLAPATPVPTPHAMRTPTPRALRGAALATLLFAVAVTLTVPGTVARWRNAHEIVSAEQQEFRDGVRALPDAKSVVFVRYAPGHDVHFPLVRNEGDLARARAWTVHDRGADNMRLMDAAPDRVAYLYDQGSHSFFRLVRP